MWGKQSWLTQWTREKGIHKYERNRADDIIVYNYICTKNTILKQTIVEVDVHPRKSQKQHNWPLKSMEG